MRKIFSTCALLIIVILTCCHNIKPDRDKINFSNVDSAQRAIIELDTLIRKVKNPKSFIYYRFSHRDGFEMNYVQIRDDENLCRDDFEKDIFDALTPEEKQKLCDNIVFLKQNNVTGAFLQTAFWQFEYEINNSSLRSSYSVNWVSYIYNRKDTSTSYFKHMYKILDRKGNLILYEISDTFKSIEGHFFPPDPEKINPYDSIKSHQD